MFQKDKWPFTPVRLSEILDEDTLAVIESGCCERLGRPLTILDFDPATNAFDFRIESIAEKQRYEAFCSLLRDGIHVQDGDRTCKQEDMRQAQISLIEYQQKQVIFRAFRCHMGLQDMTHIIRIKGCPVALFFTGQYCPADGQSYIQDVVMNIGTGQSPRMVPTPEGRAKLVSLVDKLTPAPADARARLEREAKHIQKLAEAMYRSVKREWEEDFLDNLRQLIETDKVSDYRQLVQRLKRILALVKEFCNCQYMLFFASTHEGDTVLAPVASAGLPPHIANNLPHFNWKKASLPLESFGVKGLDLSDAHKTTGTRGIRGKNSAHFGQVGCLLPLCHGDWYRGVLVFGPFAEPVDLQQERHFLTEVLSTIGIFGLSVLEVINLEQERRRWQSTAKLLTHQLRTVLTPITTRVGGAKLVVKRLKRNDPTRRALGLLQHAEDMCLRVAETARETLKGHIVQLEREDLELERHLLSVLVTNCAEGFVAEAERKHRSLVIEESVEGLPQAEVDVNRLTIAFSNLIENAIKYSFPDTAIHVRARFDPLLSTDVPHAVIEIDDIGDEIRAEDQERIFEEGIRGLTSAKMGRIPGSGLGLWEARAVIEAHGGEIDVTCKRTSIQRRQGIGYHVIFYVKLPLCGIWNRV